MNENDVIVFDESNEMVLSISDKINIIHSEMTSHMTMAVKKAIEVGRLLTEQKEKLSHGEWIPWVDRNLTFGYSQATRYMKIFRERGNPNIELAQHLTQAIALIADPKEDDRPTEQENPTEPVQPEIVFRDNPDQEKRVNAAESARIEAERKLSIAQDQVIKKEKELEGLRRLEADRSKIEKTLKELHELEKKKQELFADSESTKLVQNVLVRSREFFTRECMQIPALKLRPESIRVMRQDFEGLIELVDNWSEAMKGRFL